MQMKTEEKYIHINGFKLWTKLIVPDGSPDNPTIVFLHDALGSVAQWKSFPEMIAAGTGCKILLYDRLGHGLSDSDDNIHDYRFFDREALVVLPMVLKELDIHDPVLYGHSDGGTIAIIYASKIRTKAVILEAAHVHVDELTKVGVLATMAHKTKILGGLKKYHGDKSTNLFSNWATLWSGSLMEDWNIEYLLNRIDVPTLIIQGKQDEYGSVEQVHKIANGIVGKSEIVLIDNCGHSPHNEIPSELINRIRKFLNNLIYTEL